MTDVEANIPESEKDVELTETDSKGKVTKDEGGTKVSEADSNSSEIEENTPDSESSPSKSADENGESKTPKADLTPEQAEKRDADIIRQIEYYFGDANLARDKFMREEMTKDDGWIPFTVLFTFKRLAALSTDVEIVVDAMNKSDEGLVEINEDKTKVRRHPERPLPEMNEERRKEISSRTAYSKGFPLDAEMSELIDFFMPYEKVVNIVMRKYHDKATKTYKFKGSVFVTFAKKEQCEEYVDKEKVEYKGVNIIRKWQEKYIAEKAEERNSKKKSKKHAQEPEITLPKGTVIHFEGCSEDTTWEQVKEKLSEMGADVAYIEYSKGEKSGYVRFQEENSAQPFLDKVEDKKVKLASGTELTIRGLTEDEEKEFMSRAVDRMKSRRQNQKRRSGHGHNHNKKRKAEATTEDEPPTKKDN